MNTMSKRRGITRTRSYTKQTGFIQAAILFGIALMTAVLGGFALANRSPTSQTDSEQAKVNASVALKQASDLRDGVGRYGSDFGASAVLDDMNFTTTASVGLFDPAARYASPQVMPAAAFVAGTTAINAPAATVAGHWYLNKNTAANAVGSAAVDPLVVLPGLRSDVCARINTLLYGANTIPVATGTMTEWTTDVSGGLPVGAAGWAEGCVQAVAASGNYVYFKVVQEN